jgi:hypothetical protein
MRDLSWGFDASQGWSLLSLVGGSEEASLGVFLHDGCATMPLNQWNPLMSGLQPACAATPLCVQPCRLHGS